MITLCASCCGLLCLVTPRRRKSSDLSLHLHNAVQARSCNMYYMNLQLSRAQALHYHSTLHSFCREALAFTGLDYSRLDIQICCTLVLHVTVTCSMSLCKPRRQNEPWIRYTPFETTISCHVTLLEKEEEVEQRCRQDISSWLYIK